MNRTAIEVGLWSEHNVLSAVGRTHHSTPFKSVFRGSLVSTGQTPTTLTMQWRLPRQLDIQGRPKEFTVSAARVRSEENPYAKAEDSLLSYPLPVKVSVVADVIADTLTGEQYYEGVLKGLENAVSYWISVELINEYASADSKGPPSDDVMATTLPYTPNGPPLDVEVTGTDVAFRAGDVWWSSPPNDLSNGPVTGYYLAWYATAVNSNSNSNSPVGCTASTPCSVQLGAETAYTLSGLLPATEYTVTVAARTAFAGSDDTGDGIWGPSSTPLLFQTRNELPPRPAMPSITYGERTADSDGVFDVVLLQGLDPRTIAGAIQTVYIIREIRPDNGTCFDSKQGRYEANVDCGGNCDAACDQAEADFNEGADCDRDGWCIVAKQTIGDDADAATAATPSVSAALGGGDAGNYNVTVTAEGIPRGVSFSWRVVVFTEPRLWSVSQAYEVDAPAILSAAKQKSGGGGGGGAAAAVIVVLLLAAVGVVLYKKRKSENDSILSSLNGGKTTRGLSASNPRQHRRANAGGDGDMYDEATVMESKVEGRVGADAGLVIPPVPELGAVESHEIAIGNLAQEIHAMSHDEYYAFAVEYANLEDGNEFSREAAKRDECRCKNRYANILAYVWQY